MRTKKVVMLHYCDKGVQRSPGDQFDLLSEQKKIKDAYELKVLNQVGLVREVGTLSTIRNLRKQIHRVHPDIIHISGVKEGFHCMIASVLERVPKRILITHGFAGLSKEVKPLKRWFFRWIIEPITLLLATDVQCNTKFSSEQQMIRLFAKKKNKVIYNYNFIHDFPQKTWRNEKNISNSDVVITTIANMYPRKGYDLLANVIVKFENTPNVRFVVIGDGPVKEQFLNSTRQYISSGKVIYLGRQAHDEAMRVLSESDIFFLPTNFETLGMVFAEAGYYGIPSVTTSAGAVSEIVLNNQTGFVIPTREIEAITEKLDCLINSSDLRKDMGAKARKFVNETLSAEKSTEAIIDLYER